MSDDELVKLTEAASEQEAAIICGLLESNGIRATYDKGGVAWAPTTVLGLGTTGGAFGGRQEIVVRAPDLQRAQKLLRELPR